MIPFEEVALVDGVWRFVWATGAGAVRVVLWGRLLATTTGNVYTYPASSIYARLNNAPPVEVVPVGTLAVSEQNRPFLWMQWYRVPCHHYTIERWDGAGWVLHTTALDKPAVYVQTHITPIQTDGEVARWRVVAVGGDKRLSNQIIFHAKVVRPPTPPVVALACVGGVLTVQ